MVLQQRLETSGLHMVAAYCLPLGGVELFGGEVGEIDFLDIDEVEAIDIE